MLEDADIVITYNGSNHFNAAGKKFRCFRTLHLMTHSYCLENVNDQPNDPHSSLYIVTSNAPLDDPQLFYYKGEGPSK